MLLIKYTLKFKYGFWTMQSYLLWYTNVVDFCFRIFEVDYIIPFLFWFGFMLILCNEPFRMHCNSAVLRSCPDFLYVVTNAGCEFHCYPSICRYTPSCLNLQMCKPKVSSILSLVSWSSSTLSAQKWKLPNWCCDLINKYIYYNALCYYFTLPLVAILFLFFK